MSCESTKPREDDVTRAYARLVALESSDLKKIGRNSENAQADLDVVQTAVDAGASWSEALDCFEKVFKAESSTVYVDAMFITPPNYGYTVIDMHDGTNKAIYEGTSGRGFYARSAFGRIVAATQPLLSNLTDSTDAYVGIRLGEHPKKEDVLHPSEKDWAPHWRAEAEFNALTATTERFYYPLTTTARVFHAVQKALGPRWYKEVIEGFRSIVASDQKLPDSLDQVLSAYLLLLRFETHDGGGGSVNERMSDTIKDFLLVSEASFKNACPIVTAAIQFATIIKDSGGADFTQVAQATFKTCNEL